MQSTPKRRPKRRSFAWKAKRILHNIKEELIYQLRRFLRYCYKKGAKKCIMGFVACFAALMCIFLTVSAVSRRDDSKQVVSGVYADAAMIPEMLSGDPGIEETMSQETASQQEEYMQHHALEGAPEPSIFEPSPDNQMHFIPTSEPTPEPTPEIRYEKGSEGDDVLAIQKRLISLGYLTLDEPTDYYGNATRDAVRFFQRQHALDQDGILGNMTYDLLMSDEAKPYVMTEGAEGEDIELFQDMLYDLGYLERNQITGYYGTATVEAVKNFQKRNKLDQDGKAGEMTIEMINSADARVSYSKQKEIEQERKKAEAEAAKKSIEGRIDDMIKVAKSQLGKPYVLGAKGPDTYDCSGFVYYCLRKADVYCRRLNAKGFSENSSWKKISSMSDLKKGDLLFFKSDDESRVNHTGIYIGSGEMIDASSGNGEVVRRSCRTNYWKRNFICARRPIE